MEAQETYFLGVKEVARRLNLSERTVVTMIARGEIPSCKMGPRKGRRLVHVKVLEEFANRAAGLVP